MFKIVFKIVISIHTLRVEGDVMAYNIDSSKGTFQSTPSAWRVTLITFMYFPFFVISIHTLRVEGDTQAAAFPTEESVISIHTLRVEGDSSPPGRRRTTRHFNPHPPRGG